MPDEDEYVNSIETRDLTTGATLYSAGFSPQHRAAALAAADRAQAEQPRHTYEVAHVLMRLAPIRA